jgi:hypothetical protein
MDVCNQCMTPASIRGRLPARACRCPGCRRDDVLSVSAIGDVSCANRCSQEEIERGLRRKDEGKRFLRDHPLVIGVDTEFVPGKGSRPDTNQLVCYQFHGSLPGIQIPYFHNALKDKEISLVKMLSNFMIRAIDEGKLPVWPTEIQYVGHFNVADLPHFTDFRTFQHKLDGVQKTYVTLQADRPSDSWDDAIWSLAQSAEAKYVQ